ncbi:hypothetical protein MMC13_008343 [Lambiella insularis]|nr:hypothetical protein [Lambiella insularis]
MPSSPPPPQRPLPQPELVTKAIRRFAVEPEESTLKSNRGQSKKLIVTPICPTTRRFAPQLAESSVKSNRRSPPRGTLPGKPSIVAQVNPPTSATTIAGQVTTKKPFRFAPQLIETTRRSRKRGDAIPASPQTNKTDLSPGDEIHLPCHLGLNQLSPPRTAQGAFSDESLHDSAHLAHSRYSCSKLSRRAARRTSFRVPQLDPIRSLPDSEDSNDSCPSLSTSPTVSSSGRYPSKHASRVRESCDDRFSGYLLALAARAAEMQLKEGAMAAYPNENIHEPVDHFAVDRESDSSDEESVFGSRIGGDEESSFRREFAAGWELGELRWHRELLERQKQRQVSITQSDSGWRSRAKELPSNPAVRAQKVVSVMEHQAHLVRVNEADSKGMDLAHMRIAASPPMLGRDLLFQTCRSPQQTRIDPTQRPCFGIGEEIGSRQHSGLWTPVSTLSQQDSSAGLWHGACFDSGSIVLSPHKNSRTGLMTPRIDRDDVLCKLSDEGKHILPAIPATRDGKSESTRIDDILSVELSIDVEFHDGFVSQIYNYLSLGYPSLARKFDDELSKISKMQLEDIRENDERVDAKGYVGASEGCGSAASEIKDGACGRWRALRLYIKEWARQQSGMVFSNEDANNTWGVRARKGSWAV